MIMILEKFWLRIDMKKKDMQLKSTQNPKFKQYIQIKLWKFRNVSTPNLIRFLRDFHIEMVDWIQTSQPMHLIKWISGGFAFHVGSFCFNFICCFFSRSFPIPISHFVSKPHSHTEHRITCVTCTPDNYMIHTMFVFFILVFRRLNWFALVLIEFDDRVWIWT